MQTGFVKRVRKLAASSFVNTLMFSFCNQAKLSLPDMTADLNQQFSIDISKEALHKRFTKESVNFLEELIKVQLKNHFTLSTDNEIESHFKCIMIKDSSKFSLPDSCNGDYPGYGNFSRKNGLMNIQYEYDLISGNWTTINLTSSKKMTNKIQRKQQTLFPKEICTYGIWVTLHLFI